MNQEITNPLLQYEAIFYREDIRRGVEAVLRRRCLEAELVRAADRLAETEGPFVGDRNHEARRSLLAAELRRSKERSR